MARSVTWCAALVCTKLQNYGILLSASFIFILIIIILTLAVPPALLAHPAGGGARLARRRRGVVVVPALPGALLLPVEHQLVEGGPAARHVGLGRVGIQEKVSEFYSHWG